MSVHTIWHDILIDFVTWHFDRFWHDTLTDVDICHLSTHLPLTLILVVISTGLFYVNGGSKSCSNQKILADLLYRRVPAVWAKSKTRFAGNTSIAKKPHTLDSKITWEAVGLQMCLVFYLTCTIVRHVKVDLMCHNFPLFLLLLIGLTTDKHRLT